MTSKQILSLCLLFSNHLNLLCILLSVKISQMSYYLNNLLWSKKSQYFANNDLILNDNKQQHRHREKRRKNCLHFLGINFKGTTQEKSQKRKEINYYFHFLNNLLNYRCMLILFQPQSIIIGNLLIFQLSELISHSIK
jgi:hypothetical protein